MLIRVLYLDGHSGLVDDSLLDQLIREGHIRQFLRSDGWVLLGSDRVRRPQADRRRSGQVVNIYI